MRPVTYRLMMSSTVSEHLVSVQQIKCKDLVSAEGRAVRLLRARRLISPEGIAWDLWHLGVKEQPGGTWVHVASGNDTGTLTTIRELTRKRDRE